MATNNLVTEAQQLESCRAAGDGASSAQVNTVQDPDKRGAITAAAVSKTDSVPAPPKVPPFGQGHQPTSFTAEVPVPGPQTSSPSVMVVAKVTIPGGVTAKSQPQVTKPALSQMTSTNQATTPGRTVVITVPRTAAPQPVAVAPCLPQTAASPLPANIQIPPGMMLIRSDSGQLMLVSQQALAQAQQGPRVASGQAARILTHKPQVSAAAGSKSNEKVTVIRMAAHPSLQPVPIQTAVVKVISVAPKPAVVQTLSAVSERGSQLRMQAAVTETRKQTPTTFSQETLESVKKCKNFLVTLIKLASSDSRSANMANNVRGLVRSLLEGKLEAEEFTEQLYHELKSTPQPCLVPFLKVIQQPRGVIMRPGLTTLTQCRNYLPRSSRPNPKHTVVHSGKHFTGNFSMKLPLTQDPPHSTKSTFNICSGSYKEDDDINDVAFMAGVNLREENAQILTTMVGSVVQSCQDQPFLSLNTVLSRILHTGQPLGVTHVGPDAVALVSHATQECLRGLLERLIVMAEHRKAVLKEDLCYAKVSDVRTQLRFMEEVERLNKKKKDEEERKRLLRFARSHSHAEDPQHQQIKQRAKELQQIEEAQLQQREANLAALAAIGPRRKRLLEQTESQVSLLSRMGLHRVTRVMLRDLLVCMELDPLLRHSLTLYRAML
ncbi:transcription initiation factor TFIID subunit 4-like isoform X2 [Trachinotus anak]|uniref:transcription initiation factor TFIID subunit 4-like isoform X2 n=1 Tax=Trachinotus anak TaxID=443729 RepID=UPI0039F1E6BF